MTTMKELNMIMKENDRRETTRNPNQTIIIDEANATLLGVIKDDFKNNKEIFIPTKKTWKKK